jgi:hypothetical protein
MRLRMPRLIQINRQPVRSGILQGCCVPELSDRSDPMTKRKLNWSADLSNAEVRIRNLGVSATR